jgi:Domain of unknown function (DUF4835)
MRKLLIIILVISTGSVSAQELLATVTINVGPKVQTTERNVFRDMKTAFQQFLNARKWTNDVYQQHEKINCSILININDMPSIGVFSASVQIQSARPVFNSNYTSLLLNFADRDWEFEYIESQPLDYNDNTFTNNLTSMLAFYAYLVLGMDYDSFSELGGTPYFQRAQMVVNNAQSSNRPGWQSLGSIRNRYWIVENLLNPQMADVRRTLYSYHRLGLDTFEKTPDQSRQIILTGLKSIRKAKDINPSAILIISFFDAKSKELANIFSDGQLPVRKEAFDVITAMDPTNQATYVKILKK